MGSQEELDAQAFQLRAVQRNYDNVVVALSSVRTELDQVRAPNAVGPRPAPERERAGFAVSVVSVARDTPLSSWPSLASGRCLGWLGVSCPHTQPVPHPWGTKSCPRGAAPLTDDPPCTVRR